ncbi:MAG: DUF6338 family protein [Limisphaerales bacterium]
MFETFASVIMLILFLVPGYIWRTVEGQLIWLDRRLEWEKFALGLLARSAILYLPWSPLLYRAWVERWYDEYPFRTAGLAMLFLLVLPVVEGFVFGYVRQQAFFEKIVQKLAKCGTGKFWPNWLKKFLNFKLFEQNSVPTAWDSVFTDIHPCWVIVTLKDGSKVYGFLGEGSHISSDRDERDLFISHTVVKAGDKLEIAPNTAGVYITHGEIRTIEFIKQQP